MIWGAENLSGIGIDFSLDIKGRINYKMSMQISKNVLYNQAKVLAACCCLLMAASSGWAQPAPASAFVRMPNGIRMTLPDGLLNLEVCTDNIIRVSYAKDAAFFARKTPATEVRRDVTTNWSVNTVNGETVLKTSKVEARVNPATGAVSFFYLNGKPILAEKANGRTLTPVTVQGEQTFHIGQQWLANADESLYGLGQRQIGVVDIKGYDLDLWQHNTHVVVPFLVSSRGYGIFWDNLSYSRFGDLRQFEVIPTNCLIDVSNQPGALTMGTFSETNPNELRNPRATGSITAVNSGRGGGGRSGGWTRWVGEIVAPATGDFQFSIYSNGGIKMWLDGKLVIAHWRQNWLTDNDQIKVRLES